MTAEQLRKFIVEQQRPRCKREPSARAVANMIGSLQWFIFEEEIPQEQEQILKSLGYDNIGRLRADATELIISLRDELGPENWEAYFERRKDHPPFINVPRPHEDNL